MAENAILETQERDTMNKHLLPLILIATLIGSCTSAPASLTPPTPATATQAIVPSETPTPTQTEIPTVTPYPPLQTDGPYLLFTYDNKSFTVMDADGSGRKQFQLPNDGYIWDLDKSVSPDGKWIVYFTGSTDEPYDLALNIYDLSDGSSQLISNLIAPGFPDNLMPVTKTVWFTEFDTDCSNDPACQLRAVENSFYEGIRGFGWSSDSKNLAFISQIDGPSSDLYVYDINKVSIRRITNEIENLQLISWVPDGKNILYESIQPGAVYSKRYLHVVNPNLEYLQQPNAIDGGVFWFAIGWIDKNSYLIASGGEGAPPQNLRFINTDTRLVKEIWSEEAIYISINYENNLLVLTQDEFTNAEGVYVVSMDGNYTKISNTPYYLFNQQDIPDLYFGLELKKDEYKQLVAIYPDSSVFLFPNEVRYSSPVASPDKKFIIIQSEIGLELYSHDLQLIRSWEYYQSKIIWNHNSKAIFMYDNDRLFYLPLPNGEPILVDICTSHKCYLFNFIWLP